MAHESHQDQRNVLAKKPQIEPSVLETPESTVEAATPGFDVAASTGAIDAQAAALNRMPSAQGQAMVSRMNRVQGNQHVQRVIASLKHANASVQPKLTVGAADDQYEQEADQVAEAVMKMPAPATPPSDGGDDENRVQPKLQTKRAQPSGGGEAFEASSDVESRIETMRGGGRPLPESERNFFEPRMGVDLSSVRVHTDDTAKQTSQDIQARAYTVGSDIAFNSGEYQPGTTEGRRLLGHELTHVVQQGGAHRKSLQPKRLQRASDPPDVITARVKLKLEKPFTDYAQKGYSGGFLGIGREKGITKRQVLKLIQDKVTPADAQSQAGKAEIERLATQAFGADWVRANPLFEGAQFNAASLADPNATEVKKPAKESSKFESKEFTGKHSGGASNKSFTKGGVTTETESSYEGMGNGVYKAVEILSQVDDKTIKDSVKVLALTGAFGEASGKAVLKTGMLELEASGAIKGRAVKGSATASAGTEVTRQEIAIGGKVLETLTALNVLFKAMAEAGVEIGAGTAMEGQLRAKFGIVETKLSGKLDAFAGAAASVNATFEYKGLWKGAEAIAKAEGKIGVEANAKGELSLAFGDWVTLTTKVGASGFAGAKANAEASANFSLEKFLFGSFSQTTKNTKDKDSGKITQESKDAYDAYGLEAKAKAEAFAGAKGKVDGEVELKIKDFSMNVTKAIEGVAGAEATAGAEFGLSLTGIKAKAKAEAFAGAKASAELGTSLKYKGKAFFKISGKMGVNAGAGVEAGGEFEVSGGKLSLGGKLLGALGIGGEVELKIEVDFAVVAGAIKDLVVWGFGRKLMAGKATNKRSELLKIYETASRALPQGISEDAVRKAVRDAVTVPFQEYAHKKSKQGKHGAKKSEVQDIVDRYIVMEPNLQAYLTTDVANDELNKTAAQTLGKDGVLKAVKFEAGTLTIFEVDEQAVTTQKVKVMVLPAFQKYALKKTEQGSSWIGRLFKRDRSWIEREEIQKLANQPKSALSDYIAAGETDQVLTGLKSAAEEALGLGNDEVTFKATGDAKQPVAIDKFPAISNETIATRKVFHAALTAFESYAQKKQKRGDHGLKKEGIQRLLDKDVAPFLKNLPYEEDKIKEELTQAAKKAFNADATFTLTNRQPSIVTLTLPQDAGKVKATVKEITGPYFEAYNQKRLGKKGAQWIEAAGINKQVKAANVTKYLDFDDLSSSNSSAVLETLNELALDKFGVAITFKVDASKKIVVDQFPVIAAETIASKKIDYSVTERFKEYAEKKQNYGAHWVKQEELQKVLDKAKVSQQLDQQAPTDASNAQNQAVLQAIRDAALTAFGPRLKLELELAGGKVQIKTTELAAGNQAEDDTKVKVKAAIQAPFEKYAAKKAGQGQHWIKEDEVQKLVTKAVIDKYLDPADTNNASLPHNKAVLDALKEAGQAVFNVEITFTLDAGKIKIATFPNVLNEAAIQPVIKHKVSQAILKPFQDYATQTAKSSTDMIRPEEVQNVVNKAKINQYVDATQANSANNQALLEALNNAAKAILKRDITFKIENAQVVVDTYPALTTDVEAGLKVKATMLHYFEAYAKKKASKGKHWIKQTEIQKNVSKAKVAKFLNPLKPDDASNPTNQAVITGLNEAAKQAFPGDTVTFKLNGGGILVDQFTLNPEKIKTKLIDSLYKPFMDYAKKGRSGGFLGIGAEQGITLRRVKELIAKEAAPEYVQDPTGQAQIINLAEKAFGADWVAQNAPIL